MTLSHVLNVLGPAGGPALLDEAGITLTGRGTLVRVVEAWGTVITLEAALRPGTAVDAELAARAEEAFDACQAEMARIDRLLSTYRSDSLITALRTGRRREEDLALEGDELVVRSVLEECRRLRALTGGSFDPWSVPGGVDPSAYVKGWGAGRFALILTQALGGDPAWSGRVSGVCVNAGGDVSVRGTRADGSPWTVGVRDPGDPSRILRVIEATEGHVATSGLYERGEHIVGAPSREGRAESGRMPRSATVWGPDDGMADALATALLVDGRAGADWLRRVMDSDLGIGRNRSRWGAWVVEEGGAWRLGETDSLVQAAGPRPHGA